MSAATIAASQHFATHKVSDTVITSTIDHHTAKQHSAQPHPLRVLVVDDNVLNLTILTKLLRKRFSHFLDGAPVAVDSALKALQLMRENVFDVVLMDIQMPFLSGVDCTERIRAGQDGVLDANRHATIIAVTTATGSEPEHLYRKTGFDGIIGKPVKHEVLAACLTPLHAAATEARRQVPHFWLQGHEVLPALPMTPLSGDRAFFTPSANRDSPHAPAITLSHNFEGLLKQQTRVSLHRFGAYAISRTGTLPGASDRRRLRQYDVEDNETISPNTEAETPSLSSSPSTGEEMALDFPSPEPFVGLTSSTSSPPHATVPFAAEDTSPMARPALHRRQASLTISQRGLQDQLQREIDAAQFDVKFANATAGSSSLDAPFNMHRTLPKIQLNRAQRYSTPDALQFDTLLDGDYGGDANATVKSTHSASQAAHKRPGLPDGFALASPLDCNEDDYDTLSPLASPRHLYALMPPPPPRRPGVYPRQKITEGERRRSSADQSTTSSASTNDSSSRSGSVSTSSDSNMRSDSMVTETSDADQELDSPLTTPDTEYPPAHDDDDDGGTQHYCPFRLGALKHQLEEDLSMTPEKCSHADACVDDQYDYTGPAAVI